MESRPSPQINRSLPIYLFQRYLLTEELLKPHFLFTTPGIIETTQFIASLRYNLFMIKKGKYNKIDRIGEHAYLSIIPNCLDGGTEEEICRQMIEAIEAETGLRVELIVSVVQNHELFCKSVVGPHHWVPRRVAHYHLPMADFTAKAHPHHYVAAIDVSRQVARRGGITIFHCKAGKSRSGSVAGGHIAIEGDGWELEAGAELSEIMAHLKKHRPQVEFSEGKQDLLEAAVKIMQDNPPPVRKDFTIRDDKQAMTLFKQFLSSLEIKNAIAQFTSFKCMGGYSVQFPGSKRAKYLAAFAKGLLETNNDRWYENFLLKRDELSDFLNTQPHVHDDGWPARKGLVDLFQEELDEVMMFAFRCSKRALDGLKQQYLNECLSEIRNVRKF